MTQRQFRLNFWEYLKTEFPSLYKYGKRSKRQNEQITDIRVLFCDYSESQRINGIITQKQADNFTL